MSSAEGEEVQLVHAQALLGGEALEVEDVHAHEVRCGAAIDGQSLAIH